MILVAGKKVGLEVNVEKAKFMFMILEQNAEQITA